MRERLSRTGWVGMTNAAVAGTRRMPVLGRMRRPGMNRTALEVGGWKVKGKGERGKRPCQFLTRVMVALGIMGRCLDGMLGALVRPRLRFKL